MEALDARNSAEEKTRIRDYDRSQDNMLGDPPPRAAIFSTLLKSISTELRPRRQQWRKQGWYLRKPCC